MQGGEQKKESVCSWVEQHGLLDEPRTLVIAKAVAKRIWRLDLEAPNKEQLTY